MAFSNSNNNDTVSEHNISKNSNEMTVSKITLSSLHLKESSFKLGMVLPSESDRRKSKSYEEECTITDDYCFRSYSSFFNHNSYYLPKKESDQFLK